MKKEKLKISVFSGSSVGSDAVYTETAKNLAKELVDRNYELIYGGGHVGLMGVMADIMLQYKQPVTGVIPKALMEKEVAHSGVRNMIVTEDMYERKKVLMQISDAFIAIPGGFGTLDELFEMLVHFQLHLHNKPVAVLNVKGYFDDLLKMIERMENDAFIKPEHRRNIIVADDSAEVLNRIENYKPEQIDGKWIEKLKKENVYR